MHPRGPNPLRSRPQGPVEPRPTTPSTCGFFIRDGVRVIDLYRRTRPRGARSGQRPVRALLDDELASAGEGHCGLTVQQAPDRLADDAGPPAVGEAGGRV